MLHGKLISLLYTTGEYAVRFIPRENGPHLVYVSFDGCQIPDSPFRIQVGTVHADPGMVQAYGDGLKSGKTGKKNKSSVWSRLKHVPHTIHLQQTTLKHVVKNIETL